MPLRAYKKIRAEGKQLKNKKQEIIFSALEEIVDRTALIPSESQPVIDVTHKSSVDLLDKTLFASLDFSFVNIPTGTFIMGSPEFELGRNNDETQHEVTITKGFYMQTALVTQRQWKALMGSNPSRFSEESYDRPVDNVSWYDCQQFIKRLNSMKEDTYRLPTEAEWEYACRAGSSDQCTEGEIIELFCGHDHNLDVVGWYCGNSNRMPHPVAQKNPNSWELYDVHGNLMEWCQDWYGEYDAIPQKDTTGPVTGPGRVIRGGSWFSCAKNCRSASRFHWSPNSKSDFIGFRLVKEQE
jgi:formylglycine-generating enzyme required for sulfatase activity